jgi:hypothetical protein
MKEKLAVWSALLLLGAISWAFLRAGEHFGTLAGTTLGTRSPAHSTFVCRYASLTFDGLSSAARPTLSPAAGRPPPPPDFASADVRLSDVELQGPPFLRARIEDVRVAGFDGLAPPRLEVRVRLGADRAEPPRTGTWPLRLVATAQLQPGYLRRSLRAAEEELDLLTDSGAPGELRRAQARTAALRAKAALAALPSPIEGRAVLRVTSTSSARGRGARGVEWVLKGISALFALGALVAASVYVMKLQAD